MTCSYTAAELHRLTGQQTNAVVFSRSLLIFFEMKTLDPIHTTKQKFTEPRATCV
jgi:hypothetical protein